MNGHLLTLLFLYVILHIVCKAYISCGFVMLKHLLVTDSWNIQEKFNRLLIEQYYEMESRNVVKWIKINAWNEKKMKNPRKLRKETEMSVNVQRMSVRKSGDLNDLGKIKYFNGEFFLHRNILHNARFIRFSHLTCLPTNFNIPPRARDSYIKNKKKNKNS